MNDGLDANLLGTAPSRNVTVLGDDLDLLAALDQRLEDGNLRSDHLCRLLVVDLDDDYKLNWVNVDSSRNIFGLVKTHSRASPPESFHS